MKYSSDVQGGFTLLEVVVAMSIFVIGILATVQMGYFSVRNVTTGNIVTQATLLAQSRVEQIKQTVDITKLKDDFGDESDVVPLAGNGQPIVGGASFDITYSFTDPVGGWRPGTLSNCGTPASLTGSGSCLAVVTVIWNRAGGGRGGQGQVQMHTLTQGGGI